MDKFMGPMYLYYFTSDKNFPFFIQYGHHDEDVLLHEHKDFAELVIVLNGTAMHHVDDESYFIKKGDVFVIKNGVLHGYQHTNNLQICNIMFSPDFFFKPEIDIRKLPGFHALFVLEPYLTQKHSFQSHLQLELSHFEIIRTLTEQILKEYQNNQPGKTTILTSYFLVLVTKLSRYYNIPENIDVAKTINIANSVSYMEQHFKNSLSMQKLAEMSNLSVRHFSRIFSATYNTTPGNYLLLMRLQHACHLLKDTQKSISEIAYCSGFNDSNYFSRQFRKTYQMTPREYRKHQIL